MTDFTLNSMLQEIDILHIDVVFFATTVTTEMTVAIFVYCIYGAPVTIVCMELTITTGSP